MNTVSSRRYKVALTSILLVVSGNLHAVKPILHIEPEPTLSEITVIGRTWSPGDELFWTRAFPNTFLIFETSNIPDVIDVVDPTPRRTTAECDREAKTMTVVLAEASAAALSSGVQPGKEIMQGTAWGDPKYSGGGWTKRQVVTIYHEAKSTGPIREFKVTIHYMHNIVSNQLDDFKFVNTVS